MSSVFGKKVGNLCKTGFESHRKQGFENPRNYNILKEIILMEMMLNFTVGPVMSCQEVLDIAGISAPYFRTPEFSGMMLQNEKLILKFLNAPDNSRCVFLTASGTGAMEACVANILDNHDKVIVINGGSFGHRFVDLCELYGYDMTEVKCKFGQQIKKEQLDGLAGKGYTALLINMNETSSGVLYNMSLISKFCKENNILFIIDAISSFITDEIDMAEFGADAIIIGSQKALAVQPGIAVIALAPATISRIQNNKEKCMYLSLKEALKNMERGQTPFTPAVITLLQINKRLNIIRENGGIKAERERIAELADYFRKKIRSYPFEFIAQDKSNAVTALHPVTCGAKKIVCLLRDEYNIWACPNGGDLADKVFRIGHIGNITKENYNTLFAAFDDMKRREVI